MTTTKATDTRELWVVENSIGAIKNHDVNEQRMRRGCLDHEGERVVRYVPDTEQQALASRPAPDLVRRIGALLATNGCDCECEHGPEDHDGECTRCLACLIGMELTR